MCMKFLDAYEDYHSSGYGLWDVVDGQKKMSDCLIN